MGVARKLAKIRLVLWFVIPLAVALVGSGLAAPAGATTVTTLGNVVSMVGNARGGSTCALISTGKVDCWGNNGNGQLGDGSTTDSDVPVPVIGLTGVKALATSYDGGSFCAVLSTGKVKCWGYNPYGELGNGTTTSFTLPVSVKNISTATGITGGDYGFCAVLSTSHVDCWGYGGNGDLGNGTFSNSDVPVAVHKITNAAKVFAGYYGFCALLSTSHVDCWGYNGNGELGNGNTTTSNVPVATVGISTATAIAADSDGGTYCARLSTGHVDCWGYNSNGELGNGSTTSSDVPVAAKGITTATAVVGAADASGSFCARLSTGHVDCWGYNGYGELGNGNTTTFTLPVAVKNLSTATVVTGGQDGFCARLSTSHLDCWGYGSDGDLGNGTFTGSDVPVAVHTITNATEPVAGYYGFCALLSTTHVDCWGYGGYGQLGNGTFTSSDVPVAVLAAS
jgi:alpha-tubulin suppressor-like RCC1 family protein